MPRPAPLLLLLALLLLPPAALAAEKRVLVLDSHARDFPATEFVEQSLRETLAASSNPATQLTFEYLNLTRFRDISQREAQADLLRRRYGGEAVDLVITVDAPAALFLMEYDLFPESPALLSCIPESLAPRIRRSRLRDRAHCLCEPDAEAAELVDSMLRLKPETKRIYLVSGASDNDRLRALAARRALADRAGTVETVDLSGLALGDILERCAALPPDSLVFFSTLFVDARDRSFVPKAVLQALAASTSAPIFGQYDMYLGNGAVGGPLLSMRLQGKKAGEAALSCLRGHCPDETREAVQGLTVTLYDGRQLERHGIDARLLPEGATVLFKQAGIWDLYKYHIIGLVALLVLQFALIAGLVVNLRRRKRVQADLYAHQRELHDLAGRLISSREEELGRLAREFHDDYAQRLAAVAIETGALELQTGRGETATPERIGHIKDQLINLSDDIHALSRELHPTILKDLGLRRALDALCLGFADREGVAVICRVEADCENLPAGAALCAYRVIQEALRNTAKYARATQVEVEVRRDAGPDGERLTALIMDDGVGFDPGKVRHTPGIGLASMRERAQYAHGECVMQSAPGQGTMVRLSLPLTTG